MRRRKWTIAIVSMVLVGSCTSSDDTTSSGDEAEVLGVVVTTSPASVSTAAVVSTTDSTTTTTVPETTTPTTHPETTTTTSGAAPPTPSATATADLATSAEALVTYPFREVLDGWTITYGRSREDVRGLTFPRTRTIEIYIREGDTAATVARVLAHEVGHAIDVDHHDDADRQRWREARGIDPSVPWWPNDTTFDFDTAAGDWAESFAVWQTGATNQSNVAGTLTADQIAVLESLLP